MKPPLVPLVLILGLFAASTARTARAAAIGASMPGCKAQADATQAATLRAKKDTAGLDAFGRRMSASGACIPFAKGITVDIDQKGPALSCVRLTGDLSCYWIANAVVDEHPGEKGRGGEGGKRGGRRQGFQ
jgi:hypothetical protein